MRAYEYHSKKSWLKRNKTAPNLQFTRYMTLGRDIIVSKGKQEPNNALSHEMHKITPLVHDITQHTKTSASLARGHVLFDTHHFKHYSSITKNTGPTLHGQKRTDVTTISCLIVGKSSARYGRRFQLHSLGLSTPQRIRIHHQTNHVLSTLIVGNLSTRYLADGSNTTRS